MKGFCVILLPIILMGCSRSLDNGYVEVTADSSWTVNLPKRLKSSSDLHPFAPIQYWNRREAFFVVGLSESKDSMESADVSYSLEDYAWYVQDQLCENADSCALSIPVMDSCSALPCMDAEWIAWLPDDGMEILYRIRVCEGSERFYQLICWTTPSRGEKQRAAMDHITQSLREIVEADSQALAEPNATTP